jgi:hypothetical protein
MVAIGDGRETRTAHDGRTDGRVVAPEIVAAPEVLTALEALAAPEVLTALVTLVAQEEIDNVTPAELQSCCAKFSAAI